MDPSRKFRAKHTSIHRLGLADLIGQKCESCENHSYPTQCGQILGIPKVLGLGRVESFTHRVRLYPNPDFQYTIYRFIILLN